MNTFSSICEGVGFYRKASEILREKHGLNLNTHVCPVFPDCKNNNSTIYKIKRGSSKNGKGLYARALYDSSKDKFQFLYCGSYLRPHEKGHRKCIDWFKKPRTELHLPTFEPHEIKHTPNLTRRPSRTTGNTMRKTAMDHPNREGF